MASKVYFMDDHANHAGESTPFKAVKLLRDAGIETLFKKGDTVGIKIHSGEFGNSLNLRPHWISYIVDEVKRLGGYPIVIESNINIWGQHVGRTDSVTHKKTLARHGITEETMGCPVSIGSGFMDCEGVKVDVPHGVYMNHTYVAKHMADLDAVIVVSHFKGHPQGVFGGAIKNVGIGMCATRGKLSTHFVNHPKYGIKAAELNQEAVDFALQQPSPNMIDMMINECAFDAYEVKDGKFVYHRDKCTQCGSCFMEAFFGGAFKFPADHLETTPLAIADSAAGIINHIGKDNWMFVNYAFDITPSCDCNPFHDRPMVSNIGTFVSKDPVAVDMACIEASEELYAVPGSQADVMGLSEPNTERFTNCSSMAKLSQWGQINAAIYNGIGTSEYTLIESEPFSEYEVKTMYLPYAPHPEKVLSYVNREYVKRQNFDVEADGVIAADEPRIAKSQLYAKPTGKVGEMSIEDDQ